MGRVLIFLTFVLGFNISTFAQYSQAPNGLLLKAVGADYYSPAVWGEKIPGEGNFGDNSSEAINQMTFGIELGYSRYLTEGLGLIVPIRYGKVDILGLDPIQNPANTTKNFLSADILLQLKYFKESQFVNPYLVSGIGMTFIKDESKPVHLVVGGGFDFRLARNFYLQLQSEYRHQFSEDRHHLHHTFGLLIALQAAKPLSTSTPPIEVKPVDTDGDGVVDNDDDCPKISGTASLNGCPDSDGDGIADKDDSCPTEVGTKANKGCPEAKDTDGDGILDENDKCPNTKGIAMFGGCPDTDNDGIEDARDKCPSIAGIPSNSGCPEIKKEDQEMLIYATQAVEFETGKDIIRTSSYGILDKIVDILERYPSYSLRIGGHTDSVGSSESNQKLSEKRAKSCYQYMVKKGIDSKRVTYIGYGEKQPIADNKFKDGRQKNRRVEFDLYLK